MILILVFFLIFQFQDLTWSNPVFLILKKTGLFVILLGSVFMTNFVAKKNGLSKDSGYTIFFYFLFLLFFPSLFNNTNLIIANFFVLLALRRLISLQTQKASKEKIFDASLWIFLASLFHFWSVLFILLVFISIIFHVYRDYRNWVIPFIAFFVAGIISMLLSMLFYKNAVRFINTNAAINFKMDYFTNNYQNGALSIYATIALFFVVSMIASLSNRPQVLHSSYKKIIGFFFIGIMIFVVSSNKSNDLLVYTIAPLSIIVTSHIEMKQPKLQQEMILFVLIACGLFAFFSQL